jgi:hypothetical protein
VFASYLGKGRQQMGKRVLLDGKEPLRMTCQLLSSLLETPLIPLPVKYEDSIGGYDQRLYIKGRMVSSITASMFRSTLFRLCD